MTYRDLVSGALLILIICCPLRGQTFLEGFDDISTLNDWFFQNNSTSPDLNWHQGNPVNFDAYEGVATSFIGVGYQSSSASAPVTLSNWVLSQSRTFNNGDIITFYTRSMDVTPVFPDRLEVRLSEDGNNTNVGFAPEDVGSFTTVLLSINPSLSTTGYPSSWTQYTITLSGLSGPTNGRLGFRYFVTGGGPGGSNSNYIGIDSFTYYSTLSPPTNDDCANADSIDHAAVCTPVNGSLQVATESLSGCDGVANNDVWYQFTANSNATSIELIGSSEMDAVMEIYSGSCASLTSVSCVNATYDGGIEATSINGLIPGQDYFIRIYDWYEWIPNTMDFSLCVESFDQCNMDAGINSTPENEACGDNTNGGCFVANPAYQDVTCHESVFGSCWSENGLKDYDWYRFEIFETGSTTINISSEFPVTVDIFDIGNCAVPQLIESNSYNSCDQNTINLNILSGTYAVVVQPTSSNELLCGGFNEYEVSFVLPISDVQLNLSGSIEFCEDSPLEIYTTQNGGVFNWIQNGASISTSDTLNLNSSGPVYLAYTNQNGCPSTASDTIDVLMNPLNSAGFTYGSTELCIGNGIVTPTVDNQGEFSASAGLDINVMNGAINTDNAMIGVYLITHETDGICPDSVAVEISISSYPDIDFSLPNTVLCDTSMNFELIATPTGGVFSGNGVLGTEFSPSFAGVGIHEITYTYDNSGCIGTATESITVENCSSVNELDLLFSIQPNPCQNEINVHSGFIGNICVYSSLGEPVLTVLKMTQTKTIINTTHLRSGVYYVSFTSGMKKSVLKLIKL